MQRVRTYDSVEFRRTLALHLLHHQPLVPHPTSQHSDGFLFIVQGAVQFLANLRLERKQPNVRDALGYAQQTRERRRSRLGR
jgi:hypothetical protein